MNSSSGLSQKRTFLRVFNVSVYHSVPRFSVQQGSKVGQSAELQVQQHLTVGLPLNTDSHIGSQSTNVGAC